MTWEIVSYLWLVLAVRDPVVEVTRSAIWATFVPAANDPFIYEYLGQGQEWLGKEMDWHPQNRSCCLVSIHLGHKYHILYSFKEVYPHTSPELTASSSPVICLPSPNSGICSWVNVEKYLCSSLLPGKLTNQVYCLEFCPLGRFLNTVLIATPEWS